MAKKKKVKKKVSKRKIARRAVRNSVRPVIAKISLDKKLNFSFRRFIFFAVVAILSFVLYSVSGSEIYQYAFQLALMIFGAIAVAFLIIVLVLFFIKKSRKK